MAKTQGAAPDDSPRALDKHTAAADHGRQRAADIQRVSRAGSAWSPIRLVSAAGGVAARMGNLWRMAGRGAQLALRARVVPDSEWTHLPRVLYRQRRMAPAPVHSGPRHSRRNPDVRILRARDQAAAADGLLQRSAAARLHLGHRVRARRGSLGPGDLQTRAIVVAGRDFRRIR